MASFFMFENKDAGLAYERALTHAGHEKYHRWTSMMRAGFGLIDHEHAGNRVRLLRAFLNSGRPIFVYPHTPLAFFLWDGGVENLPVSCNFVAGEAARQSMRAYGYKSRIEMVGFSRCEVKPFTPTSGTRLLFVPARLRGGSGGYATKEYTESTPRAFQFVLDNLNYFEQVTVCYTRDFVDPADHSTTGIRFIHTTPNAGPSPTADMLKYIDEADIVISCETVGCLAVARGKPTIFYNTKSTPALSGRYIQNYERYRQWYQFPLDLLDLTVNDVLGFRKAADPRIEEWKRGAIGGNFDEDKFLSVVREYI
jgi:hypothetical protein